MSGGSSENVRARDHISNRRYRRHHDDGEEDRSSGHKYPGKGYIRPPRYDRHENDRRTRRTDRASGSGSRSHRSIRRSKSASCSSSSSSSSNHGGSRKARTREREKRRKKSSRKRDTSRDSPKSLHGKKRKRRKGRDRERELKSKKVKRRRSSETRAERRVARSLEKREMKEGVHEREQHDNGEPQKRSSEGITRNDAKDASESMGSTTCCKHDVRSINPPDEGIAKNAEVDPKTTDRKDSIHFGMDPDRAARARAMMPMRREEYAKQQGKIREVFDTETGRWRLVRGSGEIIERIVSRQEQQQIQQHASTWGWDYRALSRDVLNK